MNEMQAIFGLENIPDDGELTDSVASRESK